MAKVIKWLAVVVVILIVLVGAAVVIVPMIVDVQKYKPEIEKKVAEATGRPFSLGGDLRLSLFPWIGVALSDLHLGNPEGYGEKDFVSVRSFEVRVKLLPLLSKDIRIKRFVMVAPRIVLVKTKQGVGNWEGLGKPSGEKPSAEEKPSGETAGAGLPIKGLEVGEFAITEGSVLWIDHSTGERREVSEMNLHLQDVSLERPIGIDLSARLDGKPVSLLGKLGPIGKEPGKGTMSLDLSLKALEELDMLLKGKIVDPTTTPRYDLAVEVSPFSPRKILSAVGQRLPVSTADPEALSSIGFKAHLKGTTQEVTISEGKLNIDKSHLTFSAKAKDFSKPDVVFDLKLDGMEVDRYMPPPAEKSPKSTPKATAKAPFRMDLAPLRLLVLDGTIEVGNLKYQQAQIKDLQLKVSGKNGLFKLDPLSLKLNGGGIAVKGTLDARKEVPRFDLALEVSPFSPRKLMADMGHELPVQTADPEALSRMSLAALIQGSPEEVQISAGKLDLDNSHLVFSMKAKDFDKPDVGFELNLDEIDVDRYLPPPSEKPAGEETEAEKVVKTPEEPPQKPDYGPLRTLVLLGSIKIGKLKAKGAQMEDLQVKVTAKDGVIDVDPVSVKLYQGGLGAKMKMDVRQDAPKSEATLKAKGIQSGPLLQDVADKDFIEGMMNAQVALKMQGYEPEQIKSSLNGKGELLFTDGAIKGIDLAGMVRNVKATFGLAQKGGERPRTDFSELRVPFTITNGRFHTPESALMSPLLRVRAKGDAELVKETLDFRVEPKFVATLKGQGGKMERSGVMVPVLVGGTFSSPSFRPDLKGMITGITGGQLPKVEDLKKGIPKAPDLKGMLPGQKEDKEKGTEAPASPEGAVKGLLKSLPLKQ